MLNPKVSVLIPAYNAMNYLPQTLESALAQDFTDYEIIIVDDGSSDHIQDWFREEVTDARVSLVSQSNQGTSGARNNGISQARGEYIALLDADDLWASNKLSCQVKVLDENPMVGIVYSWLTLIDEQGHPTGRCVESDKEGWVWKDLIHNNFLGCGSNALIRRACFEQMGNFDTNLSSSVEDADMWLRISLVYEFKVVKQHLVSYRQSPNSASKNMKVMRRNMQLLLEKSFGNPPKNIPAEELKQLKSKAYGSSLLYLAWQPLLSQIKDYSMSKDLAKAAMSHDPSLYFSSNYWSLNLTRGIMQLFGEQTYRDLRSLSYRFR